MIPRGLPLQQTFSNRHSICRVYKRSHTPDAPSLPPIYHYPPQACGVEAGIVVVLVYGVALASKPPCPIRPEAWFWWVGSVNSPDIDMT